MPARVPESCWGARVGSGGDPRHRVCTGTPSRPAPRPGPARMDVRHARCLLGALAAALVLSGPVGAETTTQGTPAARTPAPAVADSARKTVPGAVSIRSRASAPAAAATATAKAIPGAAGSKRRAAAAPPPQGWHPPQAPPAGLASAKPGAPRTAGARTAVSNGAATPMTSVPASVAARPQVSASTPTAPQRPVAVRAPVASAPAVTPGRATTPAPQVPGRTTPVASAGAPARRSGAAPNVAPGTASARTPAVPMVSAPGSAGATGARGPAGPQAKGTPGRTTVAASTQPMAVTVKSVSRPTVSHIDEHVTYQYNALGRRDPFQPLIGGGFLGADVGGDAPPDVGGLKVVGIVWGANDQFAMAEDARGQSIVLHRGDKVQNGFIESLKRDGVVVNLTVDGQSQSVVIPLIKKGDGSNANR